MSSFQYRGNRLYAEDVQIQEIADSVGTPCYIYSQTDIERRWREFDTGFGSHPHLVCYAVKANSNLAILNLLARLGSGFDIVSIGELERVLAAGGDARKVVFSGVGKTQYEIKRALEVDIYCFNVESETELYRIEKISSDMGKKAPISLRVNPDVSANTHPYIATGLEENKFGVPIDSASALFQYAAESPSLEIKGVDCHIGSQLVEMSPYLDALDRILALVDQLYTQDIELSHIDMGGGVGICYQSESTIPPQTFSAALTQKIKDSKLKILIEPGRAVVGNAGILLTRVEYLKKTPKKNFAIVDAAMNDLIRPSLYQAWQAVNPELVRTDEPIEYDVVGPVCETGDFLALNRHLSIRENDLLAIGGAGAYGFVMSSNYNSRPRAAEILVLENQYQIVRERENIQSLFANERTASFEIRSKKDSL